MLPTFNTKCFFEILKSIGFHNTTILPFSCVVVRSSCDWLPLKAPKDQIQEATVSPAAAKETSVDAAVVADSSELEGIFAQQNGTKVFLGGQHVLTSQATGFGKTCSGATLAVQKSAPLQCDGQRVCLITCLHSATWECNIWFVTLAGHRHRSSESPENSLQWWS